MPGPFLRPLRDGSYTAGTAPSDAAPIRLRALEPAYAARSNHGLYARSIYSLGTSLHRFPAI